MRERCENPTHHAYHNYGGRGIAVCERWQSFENFLADMGERPGNGMSLDRADNNLGYEPSNCRWATRKEQVRNTRVNRFLTNGGKTLRICEWAEQTGIPHRVIRQRLEAGWSIDVALSAPRNRGRRVMP